MASAVNRGRVTGSLPRGLCRVAVGTLIGSVLASPSIANAQTASCDPAYASVCVPPGWDDPLPTDCEIWEQGYVITAPPYPCLPPLGPRTP
jgi:hypothetical protein